MVKRNWDHTYNTGVDWIETHKPMMCIIFRILCTAASVLWSKLIEGIWYFNATISLFNKNKIFLKLLFLDCIKIGLFRKSDVYSLNLLTLRWILPLCCSKGLWPKNVDYQDGLLVSKKVESSTPHSIWCCCSSLTCSESVLTSTIHLRIV